MACCIRCNESVELDMREEIDMGSLSGSFQKDEQGIKEKKFEQCLMETISSGNFEDIEKEITPRALQKCESNSLLMAMRVSFKLHERADRIGPDVARFRQLANSVEEFTYCLLDPLKSDEGWCEQFGDSSLDNIMDDAIELEQKKFFTHPAVHSEMSRKWDGREFMESEWNPWQQLLFSIWCLFDLLFSPILLAVFSLLKNKWKVAEIYLHFLDSPYYKFVRDTMSYFVLLALHCALCLTPSTIALSGVEWAIFVFFLGRYLVEFKQIWGIVERLKQPKENGDDAAKSSCLKILSLYLSDCWNKLDFVSLIVYFTILILRVVIWVISGSVTNNRPLIIAGYLYSFNTLCLTLRAFGHVMETSKDIGTIQIALFSIMRDVRTVFWQFLAAIAAFSIAITKIYISEKSFIGNGVDRLEIACKNSGISCWWTMVKHLGWTLLGSAEEESDPMASVDLSSVILARIFYAAYLIIGVILLVNMLIALLSNTYQRTEDNAIKEWSFKRAVTIQTYDGYDPIPVPLNIIYRFFLLLRLAGRQTEEKETMLEEHVTDLEEKYFAEHANMFPVTDETKLDLVLQETERNRQMVSQILRTTLESHQGADGEILCLGEKAWKFHPGIRIEGPLLTFDCTAESCNGDDPHYHGARHRTNFSSEFPHFEVTIIETGNTRWLGIGVVKEDYDINEMPGWENGSVGYHTDDGEIFHNDNASGMETEGPVMARRGDRIRCTVMFDNKQEKSGKVQVPVFFTLNGRKIIIKGGESQIFMDYEEPLFPYIGMTDGSRVLAKMCAREDVTKQNLPFQRNLEEIVSREVKKATRTLEEKLDTLLAKLSEKE